MLNIGDDVRQEAERLFQLQADERLEQEALALALQVAKNQETAMTEMVELDRAALDEWTRSRKQ